jgi:hypothetical protein
MKSSFNDSNCNLKAIQHSKNQLMRTNSSSLHSHGQANKGYRIMVEKHTNSSYQAKIAFQDILGIY